METLNTYCFPPILSYLRLADLLNLRILSRQLKQEIEDYLPKVRSLPLFLTTPRTPKEIAKYRELLQPDKPCRESCYCRISTKLSEELCIRQLSFGTSGPEVPEDGTILLNQDHFLREDFLILKSLSALSKFLPFINKHCPKIDKLALVIDHCEHYLPEVVKVLEVLPVIKVLLLESTLQDGCRYDNLEGERLLFNVRCNPKNHVVLSSEVCNSIQKLPNLEELFLFPKRQTQLVLNGLNGSHEQKFFEKMLRRLRVLHYNNNQDILFGDRAFDENDQVEEDRMFFELPVRAIRKSPLEELACDQTDWLPEHKKPKLPNLKKFQCFQSNFMPWLSEDYEVSLRPELEVLDLSNRMHIIDETSAKNLNQFTGLESFLCGGLDFDDDEDYNEPEVKKQKMEAERVIDENLKNWTIKHLQVMEGPESVENRKRAVRKYSKYFVVLETCTFLEPEYHVINVADL